jgi:hypothetical protein
MSKRLASLLAVCFIFSTEATTALAQAQFLCRAATTNFVNFPAGQLPFPDGTNITNEFSRQGLVFSNDDSDLPIQYQHSNGAQENFIQDGMFFNLFRVQFTTQRAPVFSVSVTLVDHGGAPQTHVLTAFSNSGEVLDEAFFTEDMQPGFTTFPDEFTLTVSSCAGIAFVVAIEQPLSAERLERITFSTKN